MRGFVLTGVSADNAEMILGLYDTLPAAKEAADRLDPRSRGFVTDGGQRIRAFVDSEVVFWCTRECGRGWESENPFSPWVDVHVSSVFQKHFSERERGV